MTRRIALAIVSLAAVAGQIEARTRPAFAVTSVKPTQPDARGINLQFLPGGRLVITGFPLHIIIAIAYNLPFQSSRLTGGPDWVRSSRYDIEATAEPGAIPPSLTGAARAQKMKLMLQSLLADRFKLAMRTETREMAVFELVAAKDGPKLEKAKVEEKDCPTRREPTASCHQFAGGQGRGMHGQAVDLSDLAQYVENWTERPVLDRTGSIASPHRHLALAFPPPRTRARSRR